MTSLILLIVSLLLGLYVLVLRTTLRDLQTDLRVHRAKTSRYIEQITQRKAQLSQTIQHYDYQNSLMMALANSAYDALIVVDDECRVIALNQAAQTLFPAEQPVNQKLIDLTHKTELSMMVDDALINQEVSFEEQMTIDDRHYRVRAQVYRLGEQVFVGLALHDITQLVKLNRARRDMVANISHELRTPIANIRLIIDGLFHEQDKPKRKDTISSLRAIAKETDNLLWLVQEMSDLSMIESGQSIVRLVEQPLEDIVEEAVERMAERSDAHDIQLVRHIPAKLMVLCDRDLIQRVFVNLIHNALKWSPRGDAVTISAVEQGDEVVITVLDNGPGVPPEAVDRIFERFYQVDASRSSGEGSGLGLAICRHIVEAHGGRIWAESNANGGGGRFSFTLLSVPPADDTPPRPNFAL
ncbi:MAG: hypothetical protein CUN56_07610 [Phototrophicales bacterium]|nr:MAG: hypothetical protein CUN56_07610 [Phototrophicales bacterium]RMG73819.1 MAG: PAS domain-containing protein [Chloroflexota bacterium]